MLAHELIAGCTPIPLAGKKPVASGWSDATRLEDRYTFCSQARVEKLGQVEDVNVGILTGRNRVQLPDGTWTGVVVLDVDVKDGRRGDKVLEALEEEYGPLPETLQVETPSGGWHLYFIAPEMPRVSNRVFDALARKLGFERSHIEYQNDGYQVVMPGSWLSNGSYGWVDKSVPVASLPHAWVEYLAQAALATATRKGAWVPEPIDLDTEKGRERVAMGIEACLTMPPSQEDGEGGKRLLNLAIRLVRRFELPLDVAHALIVEHFNPRCTDASGQPYPWSDEDIEHKLQDARDKSAIPPGLDPRVDPEELRERFSPEAKLARGAERMNKPKPSTDEPHVYDIEFGRDGAVPGAGKASLSEVVDFLSGLSCDKWQEVFSFDVMKQAVRAYRPPIRLDAERDELTEVDWTRIAYWFAKRADLQVSIDTVARAVEAAARMRETNALEEYFRSLPPSDGTAVEQLCDVLGAQGIERTYIRKFLLSAVRRAIRPGCKADSILALRSAPGARKSSFMQALFGAEWCSESLSSFGEKEVGEKMQGRWCIELSELGKYLRQDRDEFISFVTRLGDTYRPAYARGRARKHARSCVLFASINEREIYRDEEKADIRRIWVVDLEDRKINIERVIELRDAVWSEAHAATLNDVWHGPLLVQGEAHWLSDQEEATNKERAKSYSQDADPWNEAVLKFIRGKKEVSQVDVLGATGVKTKDMTQADSRRVRRILRELECVELRRVLRNGNKCDVWRVPESLTGETKPADVIPIRR